MIENVDLIILVALTFIVTRWQSRSPFAVSMLSGVKLFVSKRFSDFVRAAAAYGTDDKAKKDAEEIPVDFLLTQLNLSMMEINGSKDTEALLKHQKFSKFFEMITIVAAVATLSVAVTSATHCLFPALSTSLWTSFLVGFLCLLSLQTLFQIVVIRGWRAPEVKVSVAFGALVFLVLSSLALVKNFSFMPQHTIEAVAVHIHSLLMQISESFVSQPERSMIIHLVRFMFIIFVAFSAMVLYSSAISTTQTLVKMSLGKQSERANKLWISLLWLDFFFPVFLVAVFSPLFVSFMQCETLQDSQTCASNSLRSPSSLFALQIALIFFYTLLRLALLKKHLQSFMDYSVENVSLMVIAAKTGNVAFGQLQHKHIEGRSMNLMTTATQNIAVPMIFWSLLLLMLRSSAVGTGMCPLIRTAAGLSNDEYYQVVRSVLSHNTSAIAMEQASSPYFYIAFWRLMGVIESVGGQKLPPGIILFKQFAMKIANIIQLPVVPAISLFQSSTFYIVLVWFAANILSVLMWLIYPQGLKDSVSSPKE